MPRRRFRVTTQSRHAHPIAANQLARRFRPSAYAYPRRDQAWAADITYLRTREGWLYLAVLLDVGTRRVIGWCADRQLGQALTLRPLRAALAVRRPAPGLIHHSDRGQQYASRAYQRVLAQHGIIPSMSRGGDCWDNAVVESFFASLKRELAGKGWQPRTATRAEVCQILRWHIDVWYNQRRRHATLGFLSPYQYERELLRVRSD
jgi:transposase InsO family protein